VFDRSHYEDVLVPRVEGLITEAALRERYDEINAFEAELAGQGVTVMKCMLHISPQEQAERLLARLEDPAKRWKYNPGDLDSRAKWADYQQAYDDALRHCDSDAAPWYVVPSDRKWYRNWVVASLLAETQNASAAASAAIGSVSTHATAMLPATPQRTAESRFVEPTPRIDAVIVCVVEIGAANTKAVV
jgi:polyphosphate kinase 2 (PPK2 family)